MGKERFSVPQKAFCVAADMVMGVVYTLQEAAFILDSAVDEISSIRKKRQPVKRGRWPDLT